MFFVIALILINSILTFIFKQELKTYETQQSEINRMRFLKENILVNLNNVDMSVRGYLLVENDAFINTFVSAESTQKEEFIELESGLKKLNYDIQTLINHKKDVITYYELMHKVVQLHKTGDNQVALAIIKEDKGNDLWLSFVEFSKIFDVFLDNLDNKSQEKHATTLRNNIFFQIILALVGIPILIYLLLRMKRANNQANALYVELDGANRTQIFNDGNKVELLDTKTIVSNLLLNLNNASDFVANISNESFDKNWEGINEKNIELNKNNLAGQLATMRDKLKGHKEASIKELWVSTGLTKLAELIRSQQHDTQLLGDKILSFLVKYMGHNKALYSYLMKMMKILYNWLHATLLIEKNISPKILL